MEKFWTGFEKRGEEKTIGDAALKGALLGSVLYPAVLASMGVGALASRRHGHRIEKVLGAVGAPASGLEKSLQKLFKTDKNLMVPSVLGVGAAMGGGVGAVQQAFRNTKTT